MFKEVAVVALCTPLNRTYYPKNSVSREEKEWGLKKLFMVLIRSRCALCGRRNGFRCTREYARQWKKSVRSDSRAEEVVLERL